VTRSAAAGAGAAIALEPLMPADVAPLVGWIGGPDELVQWAGPRLFAWPLTVAQLEDYVSGAGDVGRLAFKAVPAGAGREQARPQPLGICELGEFGERQRSAKVCRVLVTPSHRGGGVGRAMVGLLADVAFGEHAVHRLHLNVYSFYAAAIRAYEAAGFRQEGLIRDTTRAGDGYWSTVVMAMLEDDWRGARGRS